MFRFCYLLAACLIAILAAPLSANETPSRLEQQRGVFEQIDKITAYDGTAQYFVAGYRGEKLSEEDTAATKAAVAERMKIILAELATLNDHPWAGYYHKVQTPGREWKIFIAPNSGFVYSCRNTSGIFDAAEGGGQLRDLNYGDVTWEGDRLKLVPVLKNDQGDEILPTEYILISWGGQPCLVPADKIIEFCNGINSGSGFAYVRNDSMFRQFRQSPVGKPDVPEKFKPYLLEKSVEGKIIAVGETKILHEQGTAHPAYPTWFRKETVITINRGSQDGLLPGMQFWVPLPSGVSPMSFTLTKVMDTESEGTIKQLADRDETPRIGWAVTTDLRLARTLKRPER